jgi:hypothetical protein
MKYSENDDHDDSQPDIDDDNNDAINYNTDYEYPKICHYP